MADFSMRFTLTPRGARLARHLVADQLEKWGYPFDGVTSETLSLITSELATNAIRHTSGDDFHLRLTAGADHTLRVEVTDGSAQLPIQAAPTTDTESSRGLLIVEALATRWGCHETTPGKTVWAELAAPENQKPPGA
jgi:two-component sensor histidine kinase